MSNGIKGKRFLIIGSGRLGTSLYRFLDTHFPGSALILGRKEKNLFSSQYLTPGDYTNFLDINMVSSLEAIFITVPDDYIKEASRKLLLFYQRQRVIVHMSGSLPASELDYLRSKGGYYGSLHPLQSFPAPFMPPERMENIIYSFEGDEECLPFIYKFVQTAHSRLLKLDEDQKLALHIAAVYASNFVTAVLSFAENILVSTGIQDIPKNEVLAPLVRGIAEGLENSSTENLLTGPVQRGDVQTLSKHMHYLQLHKLDYKNYQTLTDMILDNPHFNIPNSTKIKELLRRLS
ncbi:MAG: DUF2520 domain-containing protein [Calditrichaeota bacterium]|nr:MAG: DUF2520 domain-containing protein [Calditrichota bacterium]